MTGRKGKASALSAVLFMATTTVAGWAQAADVLLGPPPGLATQHDYATVDISTLTEWELVYVPEKRKEPIIRHVLGATEWRPKKGKKKAPECDRLVDALLKWEGVEIVEPIIRANRYGDPEFDDWRNRCPDFYPHETGSATQGPAIMYGTHGFKVFRIPSLDSRDGVFLLHYQGNGDFMDIDPLGHVIKNSLLEEILRKDLRNYEPYGSGNYSVIDVGACRTKTYVGIIGPSPYSMYRVKGKFAFDESIISRINGIYYIVYVMRRVDPTILEDLILFSLSSVKTQDQEKTQVQEPACWYVTKSVKYPQ